MSVLNNIITMISEFSGHDADHRNVAMTKATSYERTEHDMKQKEEALKEGFNRLADEARSRRVYINPRNGDLPEDVRRRLRTIGI